MHLDATAHMLERGTRNKNAARLADAFEPRRNIDPVADDVVAIYQHVAEIDADAIKDAFRFGRLGVALDHHLLERDRAFDGGDDGGKLKQQAVSSRLDDAAAKACHNRSRRRAMLADRSRRARLILAHEARVADNVGDEDRCEPAGGGHSSGTPAMRMPSKMGSSWARYVGSSLRAVQVDRRREMV
jgi:hypothetical protein